MMMTRMRGLSKMLGPIRALSSDQMPIPSLDTIVSLCKRRGFIFPSSEIYNSISGFFDFGHLGVELKNNIKRVWWQEMVYKRADMIGMESSIISSPSVWQASGHIDQFSDPFVDCKESKIRFRADQVHWAAVETVEEESKPSRLLGYICIAESHVDGIAAKSKQGSNKPNKDTLDETDTASALQIAATKAAKRLAKVSSPPDVTSASLKLQPPKLRDLTQAPMSLLALLPSPVTGTVGVLSAPRQFNLMFRTSVGAVDDQADPSAGGVTYLRPETAQGIFTNFVNMQRASRLKIPFGIAQVGKAFRNEITPRNFIFRSREFEMMEIEFFIPPDDDLWEQYLSDWLELSWRWLLAMGLRPDLLSRRVHVRGSDGSGLAHYAKACTDIEFRFPFGSNELMGVAARGSYDLDQHGHHSGKAMEYTHVPAGSTDAGDMEQSRKYVPHTIEPSIGLDRLFLALLTSAYREDVVEGEKRVVLSLHPALAPVKACVMPLLKNRPEIMQKATVVFDSLRASGQWNVEMDLSGSIGKRYRRADEIGTPFCITVDVDSVRDECVTLRHRDTTRQERIPIKDLTSTLERYLRWDS